MEPLEANGSAFPVSGYHDGTCWHRVTGRRSGGPSIVIYYKLILGALWCAGRTVDLGGIL